MKTTPWIVALGMAGLLTLSLGDVYAQPKPTAAVPPPAKPVAAAGASSAGPVVVLQKSTAKPAIPATPATPRPSPPLAVAEKNAIVAKLQTTRSSAALALPSRVPFEINPGVLGAVNGTILGTVWYANSTTPGDATFGGSDAAGFSIAGIPDGAWYVDCAVASGPFGASQKPFSVVSTTFQGDGGLPLSSGTDSISGSPSSAPTRVAFGVFFPLVGQAHKNAVYVLRGGVFWSWQGCSFTPV